MKKLFYLINLFLFVLSSCSKDNELENPKLENVNKFGQLCFKTKDVEEFDEYYMAEGDLELSKKKYTVTNESEKTCFSTKVNLNGVDQRITKFRVFDDFVTTLFPEENYDIAISVRPNIKDNVRWYPAVVKAIEKWNAIPNCGLNFSLISDSSQSDFFIVGSNSLPNGVAGQASINVNGQGERNDWIRLNLGIPNGCTDDSLIITVMHEIGHIVGLAHTDEGAGEIIPGTPAFNDPTSIMNSVKSCRSGKPDFSNFDIVGIQQLYGSPKPVITDAGSGCNDLKCIWITGNFSRRASTRIELRKAHGNREIIGTYRTGEFEFPNNQNITLRLKSDSELNEFTNNGLRVYVVNEDVGNWSNYADNKVTLRNAPTPIITNSGSGCNDKKCIWIESKNYEISDSMRVEIRHGSTWEIISTYRGNDLNYTNFGITLRLKTNNEVNIFQNNGLRIFLVNERYGTFSSYGGNHITRR